MRLLLLAVLAAAAPAWADPPPVVCRYQLDVEGLPLEGCAARHARASEAERSALEGHARARRRAVEELAAALRPAPSPAAALELLRAPLFQLRPPLNERTFKAWLEPQDALLAGPLSQAVVSRLQEQAVAGTAARRAVVLDGRSRLPSGLQGLGDADAAARAVDGSVARAALDAGVSVTEPEERGAGRLPVPLRLPEPSPPRSDVSLPAPPLPSVLASKPVPLVAPGEIRSHESLLSSIDPAGSPCEDFFQYACGKWLAEHPLGGSSERSRFVELHWRNASQLRFIVQKLASADAKAVSSDEKRAGDYYAACMNRDAVKRAGAAPLKPDLDRIRAISDVRGLALALADLHATGIGALFGFGAMQDLRSSRETIAYVGPAPSGLSRREFLDEGTAKERGAYIEHVRKMFILLGEGKAAAARASAAVMRVETTLALASLSEEEFRDPKNIYHRRPLSSLEELTPSFPWKAYLEKTGAPGISELNVTVPAYFRAVETLLARDKLEDVRSYLAWRVLSASAKHLPEAFTDETHRYTNAMVGSTVKRDQSWKCLQEMNQTMGDTLGAAYAKAHFDEKSRKAMLELTQGVRNALTQLLQAADWMSPETKEQALLKAKAMTLKVGYPDKPDSLAGLHVSRDDPFGNERRADALRRSRDLARIGKPRDPAEWYMAAHEVNAYYAPQSNEIVFPAGILQPPFFDPEGSAAVNFGAIGAVVGHEMIHGFDDQGCKFDHQGDMRDWWTPEEKKAYMERAGAFVRQYAEMPQHPGGKQRVNAQLTLGENIADNGGIRLAYEAYMKSEGSKKGSDGFTPQQSFFLGFARVSCGHTTPEVAAKNADDSHAPRAVRVNATVSNMPEFREAFSCRGDSPMVNKTPAKLW